MKAEASFILNKAAINKIDGTEARHYSELAEEAARNAEADAERAEEVAREMESIDGRLDALEETVGDSSAGLVKDVSDAQSDISDLEDEAFDPHYYSVSTTLSLRERGTIPAYSYDDTKFIEITSGSYSTNNPVKIICPGYGSRDFKISNENASKYFLGFLKSETYYTRAVIIEYNVNAEFSSPSLVFSSTTSSTIDDATVSGNFKAYKYRWNTSYNGGTIHKYLTNETWTSAYAACVSYDSYTAADAIAALNYSDDAPTEIIDKIRVDDALYTINDSQARSDISQLDSDLDTLGETVVTHGENIQTLFDTTDSQSAAILKKAPGVYKEQTVNQATATITNDISDVGLKSLVVAINPVQSGSGDPSPTNVRPITGWTGLTLSHSGADTSNPDTVSISWEDEAGTVYNGTLDVITGVLTVTHTAIDMGTVEWIYDGSYGENVFRFGAPGIPATSNYTDLVCECYKAVSSTVSWALLNNNDIKKSNNAGFFGVKDTRFTDATSFRNAVTGKMLAYKIATPITYQLTPTEVRLLLGANNLWVDTGNVLSLEYPVDTKTYIDEGDADKEVTISGTDPVITATSNTRYICGEVTTLSFTPSATGVCDVIFTSGSLATVLTLPATVKMPEWFEVETNHTYEISILNGVYGGVMSWPTA